MQQRPAARSWPPARPYVGLLVAGGALAVALVGAPTAGAAIVQGTGADRTGETVPARDLVGIAASYDTNGTIAATIRFAGAPVAGGAVGVQFGPSAVNGVCGTPFAVVTTILDGSGTAAWGVSESSASGPGTAATSGDAVVVSVPHQLGLANRNVACASVVVVDPSGTEVDRLDSPFALTAPVLPPPPGSPDGTPTPPPAPRPPTRAPPAASLAVSSWGVPRTVRRQRWYTARVRISNTGSTAAEDVRLAVGRVRGLRIGAPTPRRWRSIEAGASATARVRLKLSATVRRTTTVRLRATGTHGLRGTGTVVLRLAGGRSATRGATTGG